MTRTDCALLHHNFSCIPLASFPYVPFPWACHGQASALSTSAPSQRGSLDPVQLSSQPQGRSYGMPKQVSVFSRDLPCSAPQPYPSHIWDLVSSSHCHYLQCAYSLSCLACMGNSHCVTCLESLVWSCMFQLLHGASFVDSPWFSIFSLIRDPLEVRGRLSVISLLYASSV
jgi:hypothetical protein